MDVQARPLGSLPAGINDLFGTEEGDAILRYVGRILGNIGKQSLCYGRVIADVFAICMPCQKDEEIIGLIQDIDKQIREYPIDCRLVPAFGVYKVADRNMPVNIMLDHARLACHSVKGNIINNYAFYAEELREQVMQEVEIEKDMEHPKKGMLPPTLFILLFERNGFIVKLDCYMWEESCRVIRKWLDEGQEVKPISLNVSRMHAYNHSFEEEILNLVEKYRIPSRLLELELTESAYLAERDGMYKAMGRLKEKGLLFSVDDFGTGYSSLNMLKNIPVDIVKLDREFLNEVTSSSKGRAIIRNMIAMANELNVRVIAEGVESVEQAAFLLEIGYELAQGYYYSRPLSVSDFEQQAFWDKTVTELGSQIQEVLGRKERLLEELPFLQGKAGRRSRDKIEISYKAGNVLEEESTLVHNVLILSGNEDGELQEVFLCILKDDIKEKDE